MNRLCISFISIPLISLVLLPTWTFGQFEYRSTWNRLPTTFKPYIVKLMTPSGVNVLRDAPPDHSHHHGLMFAIKVDGVNCWEEYNPVDYGRQETTAFAEAAAETDGRKEKKVESTLTWSNGVGQPLVLEKRTITATQIGNATVLDWTSVFTLPAGKEKAIIEGNVYHGLGMRFVESMDKDGKFFAAADAGEQEDLRGTGNLTRCRWMAYTAKVDDKPVTVVLLDTKDNPRPMLAYTMGGDGKRFAFLSATTNLHREPLMLTSEKPIAFCYQVVLWDGERTPDEVEEFWRRNAGAGGR